MVYENPYPICGSCNVQHDPEEPCGQAAVEAAAKCDFCLKSHPKNGMECMVSAPATTTAPPTNPVRFTDQDHKFLRALKISID